MTIHYLRVKAIFLRNAYLLKRSWHRVLTIFYWPTLELFLWGFIVLWLKDISSPDFKINLAAMLLGALIFWDLFSRSQQTISVSFLEDVWSRNLINIFASPITIK